MDCEPCPNLECPVYLEVVYGTFSFTDKDQIMLSDLCNLEPDPEALQEVIMANLGEPIELGNATCVHLGELCERSDAGEEMDSNPSSEIDTCEPSEY